MQRANRHVDVSHTEDVLLQDAAWRVLKDYVRNCRFNLVLAKKTLQRFSNSFHSVALVRCCSRKCRYITLDGSNQFRISKPDKIVEDYSRASDLRLFDTKRDCHLITGGASSISHVLEHAAINQPLSGRIQLRKIEGLPNLELRGGKDFFCRESVQSFEFDLGNFELLLCRNRCGREKRGNHQPAR